MPASTVPASKLAPAFSPNYVLSNHLLYGFDSSFDIHRFLADPMGNGTSSPLRFLKVADRRDAATVIHDACLQEVEADGVKRRVSINPKYILATLQKEASLVTQAGTPHLHDWAMGFGADDSGNRPANLKGFEKQIEEAARRLDAYLQEDTHLIHAAMEVDHFPGLTPRTVNPVNIATVASYRFTPWVGDRTIGQYQPPYGNLLLYKILVRFFGSAY